jgi:hypothetical protein
MSEPETENVECTVEDETEKAYLLERDGKRDYFPKKEISFARRNVKTVIPLWLLDDRDWP